MPDGSTKSPDSSAPLDSRFFPCTVGRTWSYAGSQTYQGQVTDTSYTTSITGQATYDGRSAFVSTSTFSTTTSTMYLDPEGTDDTWGEYSTDTGQWLPLTKGPVQDGASWTYSYSGTRVETWHQAGRITVAAGSFQDCWRIDYTVAETSQPGDVNYSILCRGVGSVLSEMSLSTGFSDHYELMAKNF